MRKNSQYQAMTQLSQTDAIKGNAADAMKAYINEVHMTLIQTLELLLNNYEMTLGKYVKGYLEVDSSENFKLVKVYFDAHVRNLSSHRSDFTSIGDKLKAISDEAEDIISLSGAGSKRLFNVVSEMDSMKKTVSNLDDSWNKYENGYREFDQVQDLIAQTKALLKSTLSVPRGYSYSPGSFSKLISKDFVNAFEANIKYAQNKDNQKEFKKDWDRICKDYTTDQKRMAEEKQKEANQHKGAWEVVFGVGAVVIGAAAIILTAGAATPLVAVAWTAGLSAGAYGVSNVFEGSQIMVTGADKAFNPLRDTIFQGNQGAYDTFGNVAVFVAGSVIPVGAALKAGQAVPRAIIAGVGRTTVTTAVGVGTNFVVAPIATSLAKSAGIDPVWANDIGTGTGFATSIFTAGKVYKGSGNCAKSDVEVACDANGNKYSLSGEEHFESLKDLFGSDNVEWVSKNAKGITFERLINNTVQKYRSKLLYKYNEKELGTKVNLAYDTENPSITEMASSGNHSNNPTILGDGERFDKNLFKNRFNKNYEEYYNYLLSDEYVDSLPESYYNNKGSSRTEIKSELSKLRDAIEKTKRAAKEKYGDKAINRYGNYSFQDEWNVENCAEIWSSRKAIMNGAKFDNIGLRCISTKDGSFQAPCKNCKETFGGHRIIKDKDLK
ncbi:T7SS effector LXG polymorphic toxin [Clostridium felsineum]|uniref:T7SS effector LXG polymorphic toxin n=1 Tax=Clostridium felsineum TaxID=36839 RepID=UPI0020344206|nr:T7SS effector LXG polymorphic toxin [Clostridium felsineum]URZ15085.1 hypothetical protein CLFE_011020 [Clostridium felsineum DSM 794]